MARSSRAWSENGSPIIVEMTPRISARAQDDLDCIVAYICSRYGTPSADRFLAQARKAVSFLTRNPEAGPHPAWSTRHPTLRFWIISRTNFLIFYFAENGVSIERVLDGRRDVRRIIEEGEEEPQR